MKKINKIQKNLTMWREEKNKSLNGKEKGVPICLKERQRRES